MRKIVLWALMGLLLCPALGGFAEEDYSFFDLVDPTIYDEERDLPEDHLGQAPDAPEVPQSETEPSEPEEPGFSELADWDDPFVATPSAQASDVLVVTVGGDTTLGSIREHEELDNSFYAIVDGMGYGYPFSGLLQVFAADDLTLVNLEGPLTYSDDIQDKKFRFRGPPAYVNILTEGSVEAVTLANNHSLDYGEQGLEDTKQALEQAGIVYCASKQTGIYEAKGVKVGLIGNTFPYGEKGRDIRADVTALREAGCDIVIASFHWGSEYKYDFTAEQRKIGRAAIDAGADVVVGHHPHVIQGIEKYKDRYIIYSLGNLVFGGNLDPDDRDAYIAQLVFDISGEEIPPPSIEVIPIRLTTQSKGTDYRPVVAEEQEAERILKSIARRSYKMDDEF